MRYFFWVDECRMHSVTDMDRTNKIPRKKTDNCAVTWKWHEMTQRVVEMNASDLSKSVSLHSTGSTILVDTPLYMSML